eukprot:2100061-Amphidinium_carterae.1
MSQLHVLSDIEDENDSTRCILCATWLARCALLSVQALSRVFGQSLPSHRRLIVKNPKPPCSPESPNK